MKKTFYALLLFAGVCFSVSSCSNGAYNASPSSPANSGVNPLNPLKASQFTWTGTDPVSFQVNGAGWHADTAYFLLDSTGASNVIAYKGSTAFIIHLADLYKVEVATGSVLDSMYYHGYSQFAAFLDSSNTGGYYCYSYLGNSGEVNVIENDSAYLKAQFYFIGVSSKGTVINVSNGWVNITKPQ